MLGLGLQGGWGGNGYAPTARPAVHQGRMAEARWRRSARTRCSCTTRRRAATTADRLAMADSDPGRRARLPRSRTSRRPDARCRRRRRPGPTESAQPVALRGGRRHRGPHDWATRSRSSARGLKSQRRATPRLRACTCWHSQRSTRWPRSRRSRRSRGPASSVSPALWSGMAPWASTTQRSMERSWSRSALSTRTASPWSRHRSTTGSTRR
jgi:hypothetical protein